MPASPRDERSPVPGDVLERYFELHAPELQTANLRERVLIEQRNLAKQDAIVDLVLDRLGPLDRPARVLDIGAGVGSMLRRMSQRGLQAHGVEPSVEQCRLAMAHLPAGKAGLVNAVGERLPYRDNTFDAVVSMSVLEHCRDQRLMLSEGVRVLRPGGIWYLVFPNYLFVWEPHYDLFWPPMLPRALKTFYVRLRGRDPRYLDELTFTTPGSMRRLLQGLPARVEDLGLDLFLARLRSTETISVPALARIVGTLRALGVLKPLEWAARLGVYHPVVWIIHKLETA
ncbi:class I SAM-dependent methyltransferase [Fundidesulfovibrio magnetotacticus]|uniref:class I SAM-dependent methyltransferase n=1 Tax=Fundidesulfovibrio magnetotacticus TaxID=2730080 RepID=UPI00156346A3|nr:class I SAM-dependent methyltransferase [Fundidesulfovibrio magnetotacticus]